MDQSKSCDVCGFDNAKPYSFGCRDTGFWNVDLCSDHAAEALDIVLRYNDVKLNVNTVPRLKAKFKL